MIYVFDNTPLSLLFKNFYPSVFKTLWAQFDALVDEGRIVSTREVLREIQDGPVSGIHAWVKKNGQVFPTPTAAEGEFLSQIFSVPHFQQNIELQKLLKGGKHADAFVVAKAATVKGSVVTLESHKPNAAKIPNICEHFKLPCLTLHQFMEAERWQF